MAEKKNNCFCWWIISLVAVVIFIGISLYFVSKSVRYSYLEKEARISFPLILRQNYKDFLYEKEIPSIDSLTSRDKSFFNELYGTYNMKINLIQSGKGDNKNDLLFVIEYNLKREKKWRVLRPKDIIITQPWSIESKEIEINLGD